MGKLKNDQVAECLVMYQHTDCSSLLIWWVRVTYLFLQHVFMTFSQWFPLLPVNLPGFSWFRIGHNVSVCKILFRNQQNQELNLPCSECHVTWFSWDGNSRSGTVTRTQPNKTFSLQAAKSKCSCCPTSENFISESNRAIGTLAPRGYHFNFFSCSIDKNFAK